jgi:hypothetical protein
MAESSDPQTYVVRQGDYLEQLAYKLGFDVDAVWGHQKNEELRQRRKDNHRILCPGDILYIPAVDGHAELQLAAGQSNSYTAKIPELVTQLQLMDENGPLAGEDYTLEGLGAPVDDKTDGEGKLSFSAPVTTREIRLVLKNYGAFELGIGEMDPISELTGVQKRLANLGHHWEAPNGEMDDDTRNGIMRFQRASGLEMTGELTADTVAELEKAYGC